jgi:hypothetical protein
MENCQPTCYPHSKRDTEDSSKSPFHNLNSTVDGEPQLASKGSETDSEWWHGVDSVGDPSFSGGSIETVPTTNHAGTNRVRTHLVDSIKSPAVSLDTSPLPEAEEFSETFRSECKRRKRPQLSELEEYRLLVNASLREERFAVKREAKTEARIEGVNNETAKNHSRKNGSSFDFWRIFACWRKVPL